MTKILNKVLLISLSFLFIACSHTSEIKKDERCFLKGETGKCRAIFQKFEYNQKSNTCESFVWGGCGEVPFHTKKKCESTCID